MVKILKRTFDLTGCVVLRDTPVLGVRVLREGDQSGRSPPETDRPHHGRQDAMAAPRTPGTPPLTARLH